MPGRRALALLPLLGAAAASAGQRLPLSPQSVLQAFGMSAWYGANNATALLDEQAAAGDPRGGAAGAACCNSSWETVWQGEWYAPQIGPFFVVDLGASVVLDSVWLFRTYGLARINVSLAAASPLDVLTCDGCRFQFDQDLPPFQPGVGWIAHNFSSAAPPPAARYLVVQPLGPTGNAFVELVVYGTPASSATAPEREQSAAAEAAPAPAAPQLRSLLGANAFAFMYDKNPNFTLALGALREYSDWDWTEDTQSSNTFQPAHGVGFLLDDWYANTTRDGLNAHMCMQNYPAWAHGLPANASMNDWKPLNASLYATPGAAMLPSSYASVASHAFQVAARYGRVAVPASELLLAPGQPVRSGLGTMGELEVLNEANGDWKGREAYFAPYEYAALLSAAYDGHEGSLGAGMGARAADPAMRVIMTGLSWPDGPSPQTTIDYLESVRQWAFANRKDRAFPAQVLNIHFYCRGPSVGTSPEECGLAEMLSAVSAYRDAKLPGLELWLSEFGYDTNAPSPQLAPPIGSQDSETTQAQWLLRSVLAIAQAGGGGGGGGVQRAHMYMLGDVDSAGSGVFDSCGLLTAPDYAPKTSFFFYSAFLDRLGSATFSASFSPAPGVSAACFTLAGGGGGRAIVLWLPTATGAVLSGVSVPVTAAAGSACALAVQAGGAALEVLPQRGLVRGNGTALVVGADGAVRVDVSETPRILLAA